MANAICTSFKSELFGGTHDLDTDVLKIALYTDISGLGASTTAYTATNESSGSGYSAGGTTLSGATISTSGTTAILDFTDTTWSSATFTAVGALIYNSSKANRAIAVLDFGGTYSVSAGNFTIQWPTADASNAILRLA